MAAVKRVDKENLVSTCGPNFKPGHEEIPRTPLTLLKDVRNLHTKPSSAIKTHEDIPLRGDLTRSIKRTVKMSNKRTKPTKALSEMHRIQESLRLDPSNNLFRQFEYPEVEHTPGEEPEPQDKLFPPEELLFLNEMVKINIAPPHHYFEEDKPETPAPIEDRSELLDVECGPPEDLDLEAFDLEQMLESCHI